MKIGKIAATGLLMVGCQAPLTPSEQNLGRTQQAIIGGVTDLGDPAVVAFFAHRPGDTEGALCTAELIAPNVLLTAAHCVAPEEVGEDAKFEVIRSPSFRSDVLVPASVIEVHHDLEFSSHALENGHDIGIAILDRPVDIKPLPFNRAPLSDDVVGRPVRLVGYGLNNTFKRRTGAGLKRQTRTVVDSLLPKTLDVGDRNHDSCNGDSGGPALMEIDGVETIIGVTSYGNPECNGGGFYTRLDLYTDFIDQYVSRPSKHREDNIATPLGQVSIVEATIAAAGEYDWYTWNMPPGATLLSTLSNLPADYNFTVFWRDPSGKLVTVKQAPDYHDGSDQQVTFDNALGGTYYAMVFGVNGATNTESPYMFSVIYQ